MCDCLTFVCVCLKRSNLTGPPPTPPPHLHSSANANLSVRLLTDPQRHPPPPHVRPPTLDLSSVLWLPPPPPPPAWGEQTCIQAHSEERRRAVNEWKRCHFWSVFLFLSWIFCDMSCTFMIYYACKQSEHGMWLTGVNISFFTQAVYVFLPFCFSEISAVAVSWVMSVLLLDH